MTYDTHDLYDPPYSYLRKKLESSWIKGGIKFIIWDYGKFRIKTSQPISVSKPLFRSTKARKVYILGDKEKEITRDEFLAIIKIPN